MRLILLINKEFQNMKL